jgi:CxxC motif-containing protein (DUF1111 family)
MPKIFGKSVCALVAAIALSPCLAADAFAQASPTFKGGVKDPGVRPGTIGAGCYLPGLNATETSFFFAAGGRFGEVDSVSNTINDAAGSPGVPPGSGKGTITFCPGVAPTGQGPVTQPQQRGSGLGPDFNNNSCAECHAQPAAGGSSPPVNPQVTVAHLDGATNTVPSFIQANGPVREARFVKNPDGTPDGGVHDLFVITGRSDAKGCTTHQPNFEQAQDQNNVIFRIPTPTFGAGQIENTADLTLVDDSADVASQQHANGIASGVFNHSGNDGTITRFGWKAQNKSLLVFSGEAYNVEQGVTNENFPNERDDTPGCQLNPLPEDATVLVPKGDPGVTTPSGDASSDLSSDIVNFAGFMRLLAGPTPGPSNTSTVAGGQAFNSVGCNLCHIPNHTTASSIFTGQSNKPFSPFSDVALHHMGEGLADNVGQGQAGGDQFRSAPLWGIGQRIFFLHDGRTSDLLQAIEQHASEGSEANTVIHNFNALPATQQQNILNFLRSL